MCGLVGCYSVGAIICGLVVLQLCRGLSPPLLKHLTFWSLTLAQYTFPDLLTYTPRKIWTYKPEYLAETASKEKVNTI